uniref:Zinc finger protein 865 n=1 Tax=Culex tarsalis TaxID=7177 RepID=A0A1Q3FAV4_CULTA
MERPKREDFDKICRLCLKSASLVNIFDRNPRTQQESLSTLVRETVGMLGLTIDPDDNFPRKICLPCKDSLRSLYKFRNQCQEANDLILEALSTFESNEQSEESLKQPEVHSKLSEALISASSSSTLIKQDIPSVEELDEPDEPSEQVVLEADSSSTLNVSSVKSEAPSTRDSVEALDSAVAVNVECEYLEESESEPDDGEHDGNDEEMEVNTGSEVYTIEMQDEGDEERQESETVPVEVYLEEDTGSEDQSEQEQQQVNRGNVRGQLCKICNKYSTSLKYHMMSHTGERPYSCPHCEKSFRTSTKLKIHVDGVHLKLRKFTCEVCNKKFLDAGNLKTHMATHAETRKYICDYENCGKAFALPGTLRVHKLSHTQDKQFECSYCPKSFLYKWLLVKHLRSHTGEKPYECEVCHKRFSTSTHAKTHQKIHDPSREKPAKVQRKRKLATEESDGAEEILA